jgi:hypothetical protein
VTITITTREDAPVLSRSRADFLLSRAQHLLQSSVSLVLCLSPSNRSHLCLSTTMTLSSDRDGGIASPSRAKPCSMTLETSRLENTGGSTKPFTGRPGSGCRPLLAHHLAPNHRAADPPASRLSAGRNTQRCPLLSGLPPPLLPVPSGLFHVGHVPDDRPYKAGWLCRDVVTPP